MQNIQPETPNSARKHDNNHVTGVVSNGSIPRFQAPTISQL